MSNHISHTENALAQSPELDALPEAARDSVRRDATSLENDASSLIWALIALRTGQWDQRDTTDHGDHTVPGAAQRQLMQTTLHSADHLLPRIEALRAWALHGLRTHHQASHGEIADMLGVPRSTAQDRWRALERKRPALWDWARGIDQDSSDVCDGESVGVIPEDDQGRVLIADRTITPWGAACPAGHGEGHGYPAPKPGEPDQPVHRAAAVGELGEEVGLRARPEDLELVAHGWRANRCGRELKPGVTAATAGHWWNIYRVRRWSGDVVEAPDEVAHARWCTPAELQELVDRTVARAHGRITDEEFRRRPGIEPVWVRWLRDAGYVRVANTDLETVEALAETPPTE